MYSLRIVLAAFVLTSLALIQGTTAAAASGYTLFGDATLVHPGHNSNTAVQLRSVGATYGGIDFAIPSGMTVSQLNNLSTDYKFTAGSCGGGAPRFQINVGGHNIFVYIGPPPNYVGCQGAHGLTLEISLLPRASSTRASSLVDPSMTPGPRHSRATGASR